MIQSNANRCCLEFSKEKKTNEEKQKRLVGMA
jgi:hypothetical protein